MSGYESSPPKENLDHLPGSSGLKETKKSSDTLRTLVKEASRSQERTALSDVSPITLRIHGEDYSFPGGFTDAAYNESHDWLNKWNEEHPPEKQIDHFDYTSLVKGKDGMGYAAIGDMTNMTVLAREMPGLKDIPPYEKGKMRIFAPDKSVHYLPKEVSEESTKEIMAFVKDWNKSHNESQKLLGAHALGFRNGREHGTNGWFNLDAHKPYAESIDRSGFDSDSDIGRVNRFER